MAGVFWTDEGYYTRPDGVLVFTRDEFCRNRFHYKAGQHTVFGGPSTRGKSTLIFDLLAEVATPTLPAYVAVSKPRDKVSAERGAALGFRRVENWPPPPSLSHLIRGEKERGFLIWPRFGDFETDMDRCAKITHDLLMERYAKGVNPKNPGGILVMDDTMVKAKIMGLDKAMVTILAMAGAMKLGLWIAVQKPTDSGRTTLWGYENGIHLFFTRGGDAKMLTRYVEILGEHGLLAKKVIPTLEPFQFFYANRDDGTMCIVDAGEDR